MVHWSTEIKIFYVDGHELRICCGGHAVEEDFDRDHVHCGSSAIAREVDSVATDCEANAIRVVLFGTKIGTYASVSYALPAV